MMRFCAFVFVVGLLSLILGGANELFDLGIWEDDYPVVGERNDTVESVSGDFGEFALQFGLLTVVAGILGTALFAITERDY
jgi:hypothetical protein